VVGIVVVSHSQTLAEGVVRLAREMGGDELALEAAGGMEEEGVLGTDAERVRAAIERAMSDDGVLVLMDLGSALMSAEFAIEMLPEGGDRVVLSEAPLVEGAVAAAVAARGGASLQEVAQEARGALAMKASQLGVSADEDGPTETDSDGARVDAEASDVDGARVDAEASLPVLNAIGLHARPAARFVETARGFDAEVRVGKLGGAPPVKATSLTNVVALGARQGDTLVVWASGPQAADAIAALEELGATGFGDGVAPGGASPGVQLGAAAGTAPPAAGTAPPAAGTAPPAGRAEPPAPGEILAGVPAANGVAIGPAQLLGGGTLEPPPDRDPDGAEEEGVRLDSALARARAAITADRETVAERAGKSEAEIFDAHLALLDDDALLDPARAAIAGGATAERAWYDAAQAVAKQYRALDVPLLQERAVDVLDVGRRVMAALTGQEMSTSSVSGVVVAGELTPAEAAGLDPQHVIAIATAHGTATAHAAILARALGIPAVVGLGDGVLGIADGTTLLLDGEAGTVQVDPPADVVRDASERRERALQRRAAARERAHEPGAFSDGRRVEVFANLGSAADAARAVEYGAEGVGLLRTEFLFLDRDELPSEEEQADTLREIAATLEGRPLIVRTLDAGADKPLPALPMPPETNPFLGVRGIRIALQRPEVLATQFRAILRVASEYSLKAMLPMVATLEELQMARRVLDEARSATGVRAPLELGIMVEVPAAALTAARLASEADFFSLGTNDLTQYTMAAERGDERLAPLLTGPQPAVLALVRETVRAAEPFGRFVGVCGELAGDPAAAVLLAGLGVTELSMAPALVPDVKEALRAVDFSAAQAAAEQALDAPDAAAARALAAALL
jgi:multiphosphoryl transfer protein